ncbi:MAG: sodium:solute symporter [Planctomycetaceae bacterium]
MTLPSQGVGLFAQLAIADHVVLALYVLAMLWMGFSIARKQRSTDDFFVGGRSLPAWAVGISLFASLLSTITYLGMPGEMFRTGVAFLTRQLPIPLVLAVVWMLWIPFFMKLNLTSAYEYLEKRFDYRTRALSAVFCLLLLFGWISVVVLTASSAMKDIVELNLVESLSEQFGWWSNLDGKKLAEITTDVDMYVIIFSVGIFSVLYTTMGGIRAVVWTDVIQFLVLMLGAFFTMGFVAWKTGSGISDWLEVSQAYKHEKVEWFKADLTDRSNVTFISLGMFFWYICTHGANQVALQRYFTVKDTREARKSYLVSAIAAIGIGIILAGVGISLMYFIQEYDLPAKADLNSTVSSDRITAQDSVFPQFIGKYLPSGIRGMVVAALFAAAMSTIDSGANSASTIITVDFLRPFQQGDVDSKTELRRARYLTASMGIFVVAYTIGLYHISKGTDIITLCQKGFNCFLGPLGAVFVLGMFSKTVTAKSMVPALLIGEVVGVMLSYCNEIFGFNYSTHLVVPGSWLVTILLGLIFAYCLGTRVNEEQFQMTWSQVTKKQSA